MTVFNTIVPIREYSLAIVAGFAASTLLYAANIVCTLRYYLLYYGRDRTTIKLLVLGIALLVTAQEVTVIQVLVRSLAMDNDQLTAGPPEALTTSLRVQLGCCASSIFVVQGFYASRVWTLTKRSFISITPALCLSGAAYAIALDWINKLPNVNSYSMQWTLFVALNAATGSADLVAMSSLFIVLRSWKTDTTEGSRMLRLLSIVIPRLYIYSMVYTIGSNSGASTHIAIALPEEHQTGTDAGEERADSILVKGLRGKL
ncbi:hypothetical protein LXA43DRAFT_1069476 [Ganoderma leucocontextum]|nr:hypothetical protein LXA43DRAFT_1069476 [Ganoderma leucocontextum]